MASPCMSCESDMIEFLSIVRDRVSGGWCTVRCYFLWCVS